MAGFRIEIRYAVLISLLTLLWLCIEFMVGLQDTYIQFHPYISVIGFVLIPLVSVRMALNDKLDQLDGKLTFKDAFITGFLIAFFAAVLSVPCQVIFHKLINPDFFDDMIKYAVNRAAYLKQDVTQAREQADLYFNLTSYIIQSGLLTLVFGTFIAFVSAWRMRTVK